VREAAGAALRFLPPERADHWRARRLRVEQDEEVKRSISWPMPGSGGSRE
jgi:hypothetical protein